MIDIDNAVHGDYFHIIFCCFHWGAKKTFKFLQLANWSALTVLKFELKIRFSFLALFGLRGLRLLSLFML